MVKGEQSSECVGLNDAFHKHSRDKEGSRLKILPHL